MSMDAKLVNVITEIIGVEGWDHRCIAFEIVIAIMTDPKTNVDPIIAMAPFRKRSTLDRLARIVREKEIERGKR